MVDEPVEMPLVLLRLFQRQVEAQCRYIAIAYDEIYQALAQSDDPNKQPPWLDSWEPMQNLLTSAAMVSKLLWGQRGKRTVERAALRRSIGVEESSALLMPDVPEARRQPRSAVSRARRSAAPRGRAGWLPPLSRRGSPHRVCL